MNLRLENAEAPESIPNYALLERVMERANLQRALKQVRK